jgi:hypothetical protein
MILPGKSLITSRLDWTVPGKWRLAYCDDVHSCWDVCFAVDSWMWSLWRITLSGFPDKAVTHSWTSGQIVSTELRQSVQPALILQRHAARVLASFSSLASLSILWYPFQIAWKRISVAYRDCYHCLFYFCIAWYGIARHILPKHRVMAAKSLWKSFTSSKKSWRTVFRA